MTAECAAENNLDIFLVYSLLRKILAGTRKSGVNDELEFSRTSSVCKTLQTVTTQSARLVMQTNFVYLIVVLTRTTTRSYRTSKRAFHFCSPSVVRLSHAAARQMRARCFSRCCCCCCRHRRRRCCWCCCI